MIGQVMQRLLAAILTFAIGLCSFALWNHLRARRSPPACGSDSQRVVSGNGLVKVRGMLYGSPDGKLTVNELEWGVAWAAVEFGQSFRADSETLEFVGRLNNLASGDRMSRAEVAITGTWRSSEHRTDGNEPPLIFTVMELEQVSPISLISLVSN